MSDIYQAHGERPDGANEVVSEKILHGTIFKRPGEGFSKRESFFATHAKKPGSGYQNVTLPIKGNFRYDVDAVCVTHNIQIENGSKTTMTAALMKAFEETTQVIIDHVKLKEMYVFSLSDLLPYSWQPEVAADGSFTWVRVERQNKWLQLQEKLQLGKDMDIDIYLDPMAGTNTFTLEAFADGTTPILPGSGLPVDGSTPAERGHSITIHLHSTEGARS